MALDDVGWRWMALDDNPHPQFNTEQFHGHHKIINLVWPGVVTVQMCAVHHSTTLVYVWDQQLCVA